VWSSSQRLPKRGNDDRADADNNFNNGTNNDHNAANHDYNGANHDYNGADHDYNGANHDYNRANHDFDTKAIGLRFGRFPVSGRWKFRDWVMLQ